MPQQAQQQAQLQAQAQAQQQLQAAALRPLLLNNLGLVQQAQGKHTLALLYLSQVGEGSAGGARLQGLHGVQGPGGGGIIGQGGAMEGACGRGTDLRVPHQWCAAPCASCRLHGTHRHWRRLSRPAPHSHRRRRRVRQ